MDLKMPVMDGYVATAEIRKFNSTVPIIAQTAYALNERDRVLEAGCTGYISKPFRKDELLEIVRQYIKI
jgi:CheY-like chemotaxis protein